MDIGHQFFPPPMIVMPEIAIIPPKIFTVGSGYTYCYYLKAFLVI